MSYSHFEDIADEYLRLHIVLDPSNILPARCDGLSDQEYDRVVTHWERLTKLRALSVLQRKELLAKTTAVFPVAVLTKLYIQLFWGATTIHGVEIANMENPLPITIDDVER